MARKRVSDEDCLQILRQVDLDLVVGGGCCQGLRDCWERRRDLLYTWCKKFGGKARPQLTELKVIEKENRRLKSIVVDLDSDKMI